ncbi:SMI1/KNR4 family protein [Metabacillus endolithicus]|uniref:SMI1/KNR4 family protein n=1 Tax=Metabacillus endolithicus TaxID=1535204 RepID=A0ABW5C643_9BACI|nr:SMI1/KNR4 family protein [Metabacillus endolithicus]UPG66249.1 SMI1/KNR4 family protein [Metabacillus endolithicus]
MFDNINFWTNENYFRLEKLTEDDVQDVERKLGVILPKSYIELLLLQNGGYIHFNNYQVDNYHLFIDHLRGIGAGGLLENEYLLNEWGLPLGLVLISGDGHSWIALDYRYQSSDPPVVYIDIESDTIINIASDFDNFLKKLLSFKEVENKVLNKADFTPNSQIDRNPFVTKYSINDLRSELKNRGVIIIFEYKGEEYNITDDKKGFHFSSNNETQSFLTGQDSERRIKLFNK